MNYERMKMRYNKDAEKNLDFRAKACRTPTKNCKRIPWSVRYDSSGVARNKTTGPTQHLRIVGVT